MHRPEAKPEVGTRGVRGYSPGDCRPVRPEAAPLVLLQWVARGGREAVLGSFDSLPERSDGERQRRVGYSMAAARVGSGARSTGPRPRFGAVWANFLALAPGRWRSRRTRAPRGRPRRPPRPSEGRGGPARGPEIGASGRRADGRTHPRPRDESQAGGAGAGRRAAGALSRRAARASSCRSPLGRRPRRRPGAPRPPPLRSPPRAPTAPRGARPPSARP